MRKFAPFLALSLVLLAGHACADPLSDAARDPVGARISADSLRGHLSFLSSDLLEGRATPSRGADIAAEYIAAQFRRAGLQPVGDDGYFQTANWLYGQRHDAGVKVSLVIDGKSIELDGKDASTPARGALALAATPVISMSWDEALSDTGKANGKVLVVPAPAKPNPGAILAKELKSRPALVVLLDAPRRHRRNADGWLIDPEQAPASATLPVVLVHDAAAVSALSPGATKGVTTLAAQIAEASITPIKLRNVVGVLPGSDAALKDSYVMLSAHYDHVGIKDGEIYNGANDDASGTVSVIEVAASLSAQAQRPRRSVMFVALFGEEMGLLGSKYYARHPIVPLKQTVAMINLEQLGRTDDSEGERINAATVTGFDFSSIGASLKRAGARTGIDVWKHAKFSDDFFSRADNQSLADVGVPAHTVSVAFMFPDYHGKDDTWDKIDYENMARVTRMVAAGLQDIANDPVKPEWSTVPKAANYLRAGQALTK